MTVVWKQEAHCTLHILDKSASRLLSAPTLLLTKIWLTQERVGATANE